MSSIRPLITITILAVVGAFLYVKINEAPPRHADAGVADQAPIAADVPPLAPIAGTTPVDQNTAPEWPSTAAPAAAPPTAATTNGASATEPPLNPSTAAAEESGKTTAGANPKSMPEMPPIPELPGVPEPPAANNPSATLTPAAPINPPIGTLEPVKSAGAEQPASPAEMAGSVSPLAVPAVGAGAANAANSIPPAATPVTPETEQSPSTENAMAAIGLAQRPGEVTTPATPPAPVTPAPNANRNAAEVDRYGMPLGTEAATVEPPVTPLAGTPPDGVAPPASSAAATAQTFAASWPEIEMALNNRQLARAHQLLSPWYGNPSLTPDEAQKVDSLLGQLAGTVIYSTEHQLEPAYTVRPGDTLETIAKQYEVPWQLLAKINGVAAADQVRPGQELKVVRGPFSAVVNVSRNQLELLVDGRYAGKFPVTLASNADLGAGEWVVDQKLVMPTAVSSVPPSTVDRVIVLRDGNAVAATQASLGRTLMIASAAAPAGPAANAPAIRVTPQDAEEISDILSVGSRVVVRR